MMVWFSGLSDTPGWKYLTFLKQNRKKRNFSILLPEEACDDHQQTRIWHIIHHLFNLSIQISLAHFTSQWITAGQMAVNHEGNGGTYKVKAFISSEHTYWLRIILALSFLQASCKLMIKCYMLEYFLFTFWNYHYSTDSLIQSFYRCINCFTYPWHPC